MAGKLDINLERNYKAGKMILEDYAHGAMAMRFLAGAIGAPFIPYYAPLGSDLYNPEYDALGRAGLRDGSNPRIARKKFIPGGGNLLRCRRSGPAAGRETGTRGNPCGPGGRKGNGEVAGRPAPSTRKSPLRATRW